MSDDVGGEPVDGWAYFGREVLESRKHRGVTQAQLAEAAGYQAPYVSKVEGGQQLGSELFARCCDEYFGTPGYFQRLRRRVAQHGHPTWFLPYLQLEKRATEILDFSSFLVMGILQTYEYAWELFRAHSPRDSFDETKAKVESRLERRHVLERSDPPLLWVVLDEGCLRRAVGEPAVRLGQLQHLLSVAESPHVTLQVLPYDSGAPPASESFTLLRFKEAPEAVYSEARDQGNIMDSPGKVQSASADYDRLRSEALSESRSVTEIRTRIGELSHECNR